MAVLAEVIDRVRRRVHDKDRDPSPLYADEYYTDALDIGIDRINIDLGTSYQIATIPDKLDSALVIRGTIDMCYVRAGEGASGDVVDLPEAALASFSVPNLSIAQSVGSIQGPEHWLDLAERLEADYSNIISAEEEEGEPDTGVQKVGDLEQGFRVRRSLRTGRMTPYNMDRPLPARELAIALSGSTVQLTWDVLYHHDVSAYVVDRSPDALMLVSEEVACIDDNHTALTTDTPGAGRWYYRVIVVNSNNLRSSSNIVQVDVP